MKNIVEIQTKKVKIFGKELRLTLDIQCGFILGFLIGGERDIHVYQNKRVISYDIFIGLPLISIALTISRNYEYVVEAKL